MNSSELELGDYVVTVIHNEDPTLGDSENFAVVPADGSADNTADNVADNTAENTAVNTEVNTADNTSDNIADNAAEAPSIAADPMTVEDGDTTTVTGEDFPPNTEVEVQLVDPDGNPVGDPVIVTTDEDGGFTADLAVPEDAVPGDYTVEAAAETGESATADLTVAAPSGDDNAGANTGDNSGDDTSTGGNGWSGNGSSGSDGGWSSSSGGGSLAQTGAAGTATLVGLAVLLLVGGTAGVLISRRSAR